MAAPHTNGNGAGTISRGNMTIMIGAAALIMAAFGAFLKFSGDATDRRINDIKDLVKVERDVLRKDEHVEFKLRIDKDLARIDADALRRFSGVVPRTEHEARWVATDRNIELLSARLNELRTATTSTITVRDELSRLQQEMRDLRNAIDRKP